MDPFVFEPSRYPSIPYEKLDYLTTGNSGVIYAIDERRVIKQYHDGDGKSVEREAYKRLSPHPCIARYLGTAEDGAIILEQRQSLRHLCQKEPIALGRKICWATEAAEGYEWMHNNSIVRADVGLHNMVLAQNGHPKIIDFEGSSIGGEPADFLYEWFSHQRSASVSIRTDIFAYGCALYESMTGKHPYHERTLSPGRSDVVEQLYADGQCPDTTELLLGHVVKACWEGRFKSIRRYRDAQRQHNRTTAS